MFDVRSFLLIGSLVYLLSLLMLLPARGGHARARGSVFWAIVGLALLGIVCANLAWFSVRLPPSHAMVLLLGGLTGVFALFEALSRMCSKTPQRYVVLSVCILSAAAPALGLVNTLNLHGVLTSLSLAFAIGLLSLIKPLGSAPEVNQRQARLLIQITASVLAVALLVLPVSTLLEGFLARNMHLALPLKWVNFGDVALHVSAAAIVVLGQGASIVLMGLVNGRMALEYRNLASVDTLTGLRGRRAFFEDAGELLQARFSASKMCCLLMLDLDHFKLINDNYGHPAGDKALVMFSNMLRVSAPEHAVSGRYGGEEFCMLLAVENRAQAEEIANRFVLRTRGVVVDTDAGRIPLTVSIGAAVSPSDGVNIDDLVASADRRVYIAKESGRNRAIIRDKAPASSDLPKVFQASKARKRPRSKTKQA